jgi:hypothetical protein
MENAMSTTPTDRQVMDERQIIALHEAGDIDTLAAVEFVLVAGDHGYFPEPKTAVDTDSTLRGEQ